MIRTLERIYIYIYMYNFAAGEAIFVYLMLIGWELM